MTIYYSDNLGIVSEDIDEYGISFVDGYAIFNDSKIEISAIRFISKTE